MIYLLQGLLELDMKADRVSLAEQLVCFGSLVWGPFFCLFAFRGYFSSSQLLDIFLCIYLRCLSVSVLSHVEKLTVTFFFPSLEFALG